MPRNSKLKKECCATSVSLHNAAILVARYGIPKMFSLEYTPSGEYNVYVIWPDAMVHTFTGFSWGYGGEGCRGLWEFVQMIEWERALPASKIGRLEVLPGELLKVYPPPSLKMWD